jgi:hypothetical protein
MIGGVLSLSIEEPILGQAIFGVAWHVNCQVMGWKVLSGPRDLKTLATI